LFLSEIQLFEALGEPFCGFAEFGGNNISYVRILVFMGGLGLDGDHWQDLQE
jgi:hypothetical protein